MKSEKIKFEKLINFNTKCCMYSISTDILLNVNLVNKIIGFKLFKKIMEANNGLHELALDPRAYRFFPTSKPFANS